MAAKNDVTGDSIRSKNSNRKYAEGWERIFGKKKNPRREGRPPQTCLENNVSGACKVKQ
jgi:hypothetical protein